MRIRKIVVVLLAALALILTPSMAQAGTFDTIQTASKNFDSETLDPYTDRELLTLLLAGTGPIAENNPELVKFLGFSPDRPATDPEALNAVISSYLEYEMNFEKKVREPLASGKPEKVEKALIALTESFQSFLNDPTSGIKHTNGPASMAAKGCGAFKFCVGVTVLVAANVALYATVAAATFAVAALAIGWLYLMEDGSDITPLERDEYVLKMTKALAQS